MSDTVIDVRVPDIGDFTDVPIVEISVKPGDAVRADDPIVMLESDKATLEVPSPADGVVEEILIDVGALVSMGTPLLRLRTAEAARPVAPTPTPVEAEAEIADASVAATGSDAGGRPVVPTPAPTPAARRTDFPPNLITPPYAGPSTRAFARELGLTDLSAVAGTGDKGRITRADVAAFVKTRLQTPRQGGGQGGRPADGLPPWPVVDHAAFGPVDRAPLSRIRRISGPNLARNWATIPHVTNFDEADVSDLDAFRRAINAETGPDGPRVSLLAFLIKAAAKCLKAFPAFNASLDGEDVILKRYYHIGFAADTPQGLVVPVVRDADSKGILQIARECAELADKARAGKLAPGDMQGGTFTISSLGGIGGTGFTPIINAPEVAILGVTRARTRAVWRGDAFEPRLILPVSLSWDHRVVDGAAAGRFLVRLTTLLGDVRRALL